MSQWIKDQSDIADDGWIYRRIRLIPEHYLPVDPISGLPKITNAALAYRDDGMSVAIGELMQHQQVEVSDLVDFARHAVARCGVIDIRAATAGIIASVDERDENEGRGRAHGLVRTDAPPPDRERWALVRDLVRRKMSLCDSPALEWVHTS